MIMLLVFDKSLLWQPGGVRAKFIGANLYVI